MHEALQNGCCIEAADALFSRPMGIPKTGIFGLYDLIGIDLMSDVAASLRSILPEGDAFQAVGQDPALIAHDRRRLYRQRARAAFTVSTEGGRQEAGHRGQTQMDRAGARL